MYEDIALHINRMKKKEDIFYPKVVLPKSGNRVKK